MRYLSALMKDRMNSQEGSLIRFAWGKVLATCVVLAVGAARCLSQTVEVKTNVGAIALSNVVKPAGGGPMVPETTTLVARLPTGPPLIVVGFAGGFVRSTSTVHGEVGLAADLRAKYGATIHAEVFENHHGDQAYREILRLAGLPDRALSFAGASSSADVALAAKKKAVRIILYGHSWGASEAVATARRLEQDGVPVLLVAEVDRVAKPGEDDNVIPANVAQAINFYQVDGILHGRQRIEAADPAATTILGNIRFSYKDKSVPCLGYPWYTRLLTKPHIEIENDPRVWKEVEALIVAKAAPR